jgi:hypothetical protein
MWDPATARRIRASVAPLTPERTRRWGRMSAQQMVRHGHIDHHLRQFGV